MTQATTFARIAGDSVDWLAPELSALDEAARGRSRDPARCLPAHWRWCYLDSPAGGSGAAVALDGDRVIGKSGSVYLRMTVDGQPALAGLSEGMAVTPEARSWHVYRGLIETCWQACVADGVRFGFAFVTPTAAEFNRMLGWPVVGPAPVWMGVLDLGQALRARGLPGARLAPLLRPWLGLRLPVQPAAMEPVKDFDAGYDGLWASLAKARSVCVIKDARYLQWRYRACPGRTHECWSVSDVHGPRGLLVFRVGERNREAYLLELLARDDDWTACAAWWPGCWRGCAGWAWGLCARAALSTAPRRWCCARRVCAAGRAGRYPCRWCWPAIPRWSPSPRASRAGVSVWATGSSLGPLSYAVERAARTSRRAGTSRQTKSRTLKAPPRKAALSLLIPMRFRCIFKKIPNADTAARSPCAVWVSSFTALALIISCVGLFLDVLADEILSRPARHVGIADKRCASTMMT